MTWTRRSAVLGLCVLAAGLAGCGPGGEVRLVGEEIAQASSNRTLPESAAPRVPDSGQPAAPSAAVAASEPVAPAHDPSSAPAASAGSQAPAAAAPYTEPAPAAPPASSGLSQAPSSATEPTAWGLFSQLLGPTVAPPTPTLEPTWTPFPTVTPPPTPTPDPLVNAGPPVQIEIPAIGVVALVEQVGLTRDGAMDTPKGWMNAAWFSPGFRPGEAGNSVIAGHLDSRTGGPAVFWSLSRLQPGDEVMVTYQNGDRYTFAVQDAETVPYDIEGEAVAAIFGPSQTSDLNLITCNGVWDRGKATYTQRLVVYTSLIPEKTVRAGLTGSYD